MLNKSELVKWGGFDQHEVDNMSPEEIEHWMRKLEIELSYEPKEKVQLNDDHHANISEVGNVVIVWTMENGREYDIGRVDASAMKQLVDVWLAITGKAKSDAE